MGESTIEAATNTPAWRDTSAVVELRDYTLHPGQRDVLIDLFERAFVDGQEALGIAVLDFFRDLDNPDRFVWLRGFPSMDARARATTAFYDGPVWRRHRDAANATMIDSDNVLLLRPVGPTPGYPVGAGADAGAAGLVVATIWPLDPAAEADFPDFFARTVAPALTEAGATILAAYATEHSPNNYPRLPIREGEHNFVWFARFADAAAHEAHRTALARSPRWTGEVAPALARRLGGSPEERRLVSGMRPARPA